MKEPQLKLGYSSPALERKREDESEILRRRALEDYNEATFGERRPIAAEFFRIALFLMITVLISVFLPRKIAKPLGLITAILLVVYRARKS